MPKKATVPQEILSRLEDSGEDPRLATVSRLVEECRYVADMIREGGSNYDDSPIAERQTLLRQCARYVAAHS